MPNQDPLTYYENYPEEEDSDFNSTDEEDDGLSLQDVIKIGKTEERKQKRKERNEDNSNSENSKDEERKDDKRRKKIGNN